jgi:hypothetical protein
MTTFDWGRRLAEVPSDWPLIPLDGRKRPIDPVTGELKVEWQKQPGFDVDGIIALNGKVRAVGVMTGEKAGGLLAVDFDGPYAVKVFEQETGHKPTDLPKTIGVTSGRPGRGQRFFQVDPDWWPHLLGRRTWNGPDGSTCLELRWNGCQSVIAGEHPKTDGYRWLPSSSPSDISAPAPAPDWLLDLLQVQEIPEAPTVEPTAEDARRAVAMLKFIPAAEYSGYESWLRIGMALHHTDPGLLAAWVDWCRDMANFDEAECLKKWGSFGKAPNGRQVKIGSLCLLAKQHGYLEPRRPDPVGGFEAVADGEGNSGPPFDPKAAAKGDSNDPRDKLARLGDNAAELLANRAPYAERVPILRAAAEKLDLTIRDQELQAILTAARRSTTGSDQPVTPGQWLDMTPTQWIWEGLVMRGRLNLLIALPKQGKTSLLLAWIAAHHRHDPAFLDRTLHGPCPPVLIVGTDQGGNDWGQMLVQAGLAENHGNRVLIAAPLVALHHAGAPLHLDPEGIDRIASYAQQQPGLLIVIDSLSACVAPLGLKEESPQIAEPIHDLMQQLEPHGATVVLIHHAGKGRAGDGASLASRGSTALPAVASQTIKLGPATSSPNDPRKLLTTEGRGGSPQALVIQRNDGTWNYHGPPELLEQEQAEADGRKGLNDRQEDVLALVRERWDEQMARTTAATVVEGLAFTGKDPAILALRTLQQLERKNFLYSIQTKGGERTGGRPAYEFWPVSDASRYPKKPPSETSETSETSLAPEDPER